jgi:FMN-dependent NADH-azoreductase
MTTLLAITVSPRHETSASRTLTQRFINTWKSSHEDGEVVSRDLATTHLPFVDASWIAGAFTPAEHHSPETREVMKIGDALIAEIKSADHIVIGTPMYNFSIPAILKAYIDHIVRLGLTVNMHADGFEGLVTGKKATIIIASGSNFAPGSKLESANMASTYLKQIFGFIGVTDIEVVLAGSTMAIERGETTLSDFASQLIPRITHVASSI